MEECAHGFCHRNVDETAEDGYCILHSPNPDKDVEAFYKELAKRPGPEDSFSYIVFPPNATFSNRAFTNASFFQTRFTGRVNFRNSIFKGGANFQFAEFTETADFRKATFEGEADFKDTQFKRDAQFFEAKFKRGANFNGVTFPEEANFFHAKFGEDSDASESMSHAAEVFDVKPAEGANFHEAKFEGKADFTCVRFMSGEADFRDAKFVDEAIFYGIELGEKAGKANFLNAHFAKDANFVRARLVNESNFISATFEKRAIFDGTIFADLVFFDGATFLGRTLFAHEPRTEQLIFARAKLVAFTNVTIAPFDSVTFRDADLQRFLFQGTDLRKVEITNAKWPKRDKSVFLMGKLSWTYDEDLLLREPHREKSRGAKSQEDEISKFSHIEQLYRQLKQNCEDRRDYERARDFHFGEKEMRLKNPETSWGVKRLLGVYRCVAGYGESASRAFVSAVVLLGVCAGLYLWLGLCPKGGSEALGWTGLPKALEYSFRVMTLLKPDDLGLAPQGWARVVFLFESIAGPVLLGLFGLALRQRLKR